MKRITVLLLSAIMVFTLSACGSEGDKPTTDVIQDGFAAVVETITPAPPAPEAPDEPETSAPALTPTQPTPPLEVQPSEQPTQPAEPAPPVQAKQPTPVVSPFEPEHQHSYVDTLVKSATCVEAGLTTWICSCGDTYDETIAIVDHVYTEQITQNATCTVDGAKTYTCGSCNNSYPEAIPSLGHDHSIYLKNTVATCTAEGIVEKQCSRCTDIAKTTTPALGHSTSEGICARCKAFISTGITIHTKNSSITITGNTDIKFTISGSDYTIICDYDSAYIDISWGQFVGDDIILTVKPIKSGSTTIKIYIEEDPSVCKEINLKISLPSAAGTTAPATSTSENARDYVLNTNTKKFHYPTCKSVNQMKDSNKRFYNGTRDSVISMGYDPCGNCHP